MVASTTTTHLMHHSINPAWGGLTLVVLILLFIPGLAQAKKPPVHVQIAGPYIELHTGPGVGYPVFYVADRGEWILIQKRRTDWFKVQTESGKEGWVDRDQMEETLGPSGRKTRFEDPDFAAYGASRWKGGFMAGEFGGANVISVFGSYSLSPNFSTELWLQRVLGNFSDQTILDVNIVYTFIPEWKVSPFFGLGTGVVLTQPKGTVVQPEDRSDQASHVGVGARWYMSRRFVLRAEYKNYVVFTSRDDNEEPDTWQLGFAFFF